MDFFEVLIILAFIFLPLIDGILKSRRAGQQEDVPDKTPPARERERVGQGAGTMGGSGRSPQDPVESGPAADMIPADLWEVLTGERRSEPKPAEPSWQEDEEPWGPTPAEEFPDELGGEDGDLPPWAREYEDTGDVEPETTEPVSPPHGFPQVVSLEAPPPPPEVRHRRFHEKYDSEAPTPAPVRSDFRGELRSGLRGQGLRRSVILAEVLGPPRGLV